MGIHGLWTHVLTVSVQSTVLLKDYHGKTIGVDASNWLYRAAYIQSKQSGKGKNRQKKKRGLRFLREQVASMRMRGVTPYIVFDGKAHEQKIKKPNESNLLADLPPGTIYHFQEVTDEYLRLRNIRYSVSPCEADAQLAYLARTGQVDAVLSEDGDMIALGCPVILTKFNVCNTLTKVAGGFEITLDRLLRAWDMELSRFQDMCLLAGCNYLKSPRGIGISKAHSLIQQHNGSMEQIFQVLQEQGHLNDRPEYKKEWLTAKQAFFNQDVLESKTNRILPLLQAISIWQQQ